MSKRRAGPGDYEKWMAFQAKFAKMQEEMQSLPPLFERSPHTSDDEDDASVASEVSDSHASGKEDGVHGGNSICPREQSSPSCPLSCLLPPPPGASLPAFCFRQEPTRAQPPSWMPVESCPLIHLRDYSHIISIM